MRQEPLPFDMPPRVNQPRRLISSDPIRWPADTYRLKSYTPGPYGIGPIIDLPRESLALIRHGDRLSEEETIVWLKVNADGR